MDDEFTEKEPTVEIEGRLSKIGRHFRDNSKFYAGALIGAGVATLLVGSDKNMIKNGIIYKSIVNNWMVVMPKGHYREAAPVRCIETGEKFASMNRAAAANGVNVSKISRHLAGNLDDVKGMHFERS